MTEGFIRRLVAMVADGLERSGSGGRPGPSQPLTAALHLTTTT